jgi:hypothetical protein
MHPALAAPQLMIDPAGGSPWLSAWLATQRDFAALVAAVAPPSAGQPTFDAIGQSLTEQYRRLFAFPPLPAAGPDAVAAGAAAQRYREAAERYGQLVSAAAIDAGKRLAAALDATGPEAPPITSLRALHALWVECGEAAWSAAAHREDFAAAQAELLGALALLGATGPVR